jgi:protein SCO1/2
MTRAIFFAAALLLFGFAPRAAAQNPPAAGTVVRQVGFDQKLDSQVPLDTALIDEEGRSVRLGDYFGTKPVVLLLVYYECPMLCTQVLNGFVHALRPLGLVPGRDFEIVTISIDPGETPELARKKKQQYLAEYGRPEAGAGWHFLVAGPQDRASAEASIARVAASIGFRYLYIPEIDQYAHASGLVTLTPGGRVSKYFYGVEFSARDLRLALIDSAEDRIGSVVDQVLLLCYHYDPTTGKYGFAIVGALRLFGFATVALLGGFVWRMLRRERRAATLAGGFEGEGP